MTTPRQTRGRNPLNPSPVPRAVNPSNTRRARIVVVGSSNTDLVLQLDRLPRPGETVSMGRFAQFAGGKGANQAVAAARAGARVTFVGAHGADEFGRRAKAALRSEGIDVRHFCEKKNEASGVALILVGGKDRQNLIGVARSANHALSPGDVYAARAAFASAAVVMAQLEMSPEAVLATAELAGDCGVPFILNPAPLHRMPAGLLRLAHVITPNEREAESLTGLDDPSKAAEALYAKGCPNVVITLGPRGALIRDRQGRRHVPAPRVRPVDTVGAGDCFTAWLGVALGEGLTLDTAVELAVRASSIAVTRAGAQAGMPYRDEVL